MAALGEQVVGGYGSPCAGSVEFAIGERFVVPGFADAVHNLPGGFDFIAADEERGIAEHGFEQQTLVSLGRVSAEFRIVAEMHSDGANFEARAGNFAVEMQGDAFVGLKAKG